MRCEAGQETHRAGRMSCVLHPPRPDGHHAHRRFDELQFRHDPELVGELGAADNGVEKRRMGGIHGIFHDLQPVARVEVFPPRHKSIAGPDKAVIHREKRLPVGWTHLGKDDAAVFMGGIGPVIQPVFQGTVRRLAWRLEDGPVHRELPAMVAASYSLGVDQPELQRRATMRTMQLQQPYGAAQSRNTTSSSPRIMFRWGRSFSSSEKQIGCQKRRRYSPHGVSGPTWDNSASSTGSSRWR
jgi:hypothetical protein